MALVAEAGFQFVVSDLFVFIVPLNLVDLDVVSADADADVDRLNSERFLLNDPAMN